MRTRGAGLDVHQKTVVARVLPREAGQTPTRERRTFSTMTPDRLALRDWPSELQVGQVVMESTGAYWKPVWAILEGTFELWLANAAFMKNMPRTEADRKDAAWMAGLLRHGLIRPSFVPPLGIQDPRELTRYRARVSADRARMSNRIRKPMEGANVKPGSVASSAMGVCGRLILEAIVAGESSAVQLADQAVGHLRKKLAELQRALDGRTREHRRRVLRWELAQWKFLSTLVAETGQEIEQTMRPFDAAVSLCQTIPGVSETTAHTLVAELGPDMRQFPGGAQVSGWAAMCPDNNESAGERQSGRTRKGNPWLKRELCQAAWAAAGAKETCFQA
jgi:transposase